MVEIGSATSRRALLSSLAAVPVAALPAMKVACPRESLLVALPFATSDEPVSLRRTAEGRQLSRVRYHNAEGFFRDAGAGNTRTPSDNLYSIGIVAQLGLSAHLLDVGFNDAWCARHIGLNVARSLSYANATGLSFESADFELLATVLSPYSKWRDWSPRNAAPNIPFTDGEIRNLTRLLLDRVREVTGHPRPRTWRPRVA